MTGFGGTAEPQLRLFIIRQHAHTIPPAFAQQVSCHGEAGVPELLQHLHLLRLFRFCVFIFRQDLLGVLVGYRHLPPGGPGVVHLRLILINLVPHGCVLEGKRTQPELLRLLNDHILDGFELLLLREAQVFSWAVFVVPLHLVP